MTPLDTAAVHRQRFGDRNSSLPMTTRTNIVRSYLVGKGVDATKHDKVRLWLPYDNESSWIMRVMAGSPPTSTTPGAVLSADAREFGGHPILFRATHKEIDDCLIVARVGDIVPLLAHQTEMRA